MNPRASPNYEKLRLILEQQLRRSVTLDEATNIGNHLIKVYGVLLEDRFNDGKINLDTT